MLCSKGGSARATCALLLALALALTACGAPAQPAASSGNPGNIKSPEPPPANPPSSSQAGQPSPVAPTENVTGNAKSAVRILQVHFRGSLQALGCCNDQLYERDEFVAIQNTGFTPQNIAGWKLVNINKGYPVFTFPDNFPCIAFSPSTEAQYVANTQNYVSSAPQTIAQTFPPPANAAQAQDQNQPLPPSQINWSSCTPIAPLDETPMGPIKGQQWGQAPPCILYPGQTVLVFTDEIHCQYGGLSFRYGLGNLWDNDKPDTAVLYDSNGLEVSRRSYTLGK
jgi:hypothetical protein